MNNPRNLLAHAGILSVAISLSMAAVNAQSPEPAGAVLNQVADIALPGPAVRFDYQSLDATNGRLYIAHMNADQLVVFDLTKRAVIANLDGFKRVHGVLAVPEINRVYASVTGDHQAVAVDTLSLKTVATGGPINYPDGLAYAPKQKELFVSDAHGGLAAVLDAATCTLITSVPLGGGAGNIVSDPVSRPILVAVHGANQLVAIDPDTNQILGKYSLPGIQNPHGIALYAASHVAFVAGEENHSLALVDLNSMKVLAKYQVGEDPDVLAFDPGLHRLYVSAESGTVTIFQYDGRKLTLIGSIYMPHAHTVSVDPRTHLVYFPLENVEGHPFLRIMRPADQK